MCLEKKFTTKLPRARHWLEKNFTTKLSRTRTIHTTGRKKAMACLCVCGLETATAQSVGPPCLPEEHTRMSEGILWQCHSVLS